MFYWSAKLKRGTLYIFRPESQDDRKTIRLKGLDPNGLYRLRSEDGSVSTAKRTGSALMRDGLEVRLPGPYTSDLIYVQQSSLGKPRAPNVPG